MSDRGKYDSNLAMALWRADEKSYVKAQAFLKLLQQAGLKVVAEEMNKMCLRWQAEIQLHMPVDKGHARRTVNVRLADPNAPTPDEIRAGVGTNTPYVVFLEFDPSGRIASGQVQNWDVGQDVILDWPAKRGDETEQTGVRRAKDGSIRNRKGRFIKKKAGAATEFMPPFRGSWLVIAPEVLAHLRKRVAQFMRDGVIKGA